MSSEEVGTLKAEIAALAQQVAALTQQVGQQEAALLAKKSFVPDEYGWVLLLAGAGFFITSAMLGGPVMNARKQYNVPLPNLYATPGYHDKAEAFNRVQRGHQNMFETLTTVAKQN